MILNESPDTINVGNLHLTYSDRDAIAFGYYKGELYMGDNKSIWHGDLVPYSLENTDIPRDGLDHAGRLWYESKCMSFWEYPKTASEMKRIADELSEKFNSMDKNTTIDIWNQFEIEIIVNKQGHITDRDGYNTKSKIIAVKNYKGSKDMNAHVLANPLQNPYPKKKVPAGMGSKKRYSVSPELQSKLGKGYSSKDVPSFVHHQLKYSSEGHIKLKPIVEDTIGTISQKINVKFDINKTTHASLRQNRDADHPISNQEILNIVNLTLSKMANMLLFDKMDMGDYILIKHEDINVVGVLSPGNNDEIDFIVVTVMRKRDFKPKAGTKIIEI